MSKPIFTLSKFLIYKTAKSIVQISQIDFKSSKRKVNAPKDDVVKSIPPTDIL